MPCSSGHDADPESIASWSHHLAHCALSRISRVFSVSTLIRLSLIVSLLTGALLAGWLMPTIAHAQMIANLATVSTATPSPVSTSTPSRHAQPAAAPAGVTPTATPPPYHARQTLPRGGASAAAVNGVSSSQPFNGLGDLPFYTYVADRHLTDQLEMKVNIANGNVLLHEQELQIHGTGVDLALGSFYNSLGNTLMDDGNLWYSSPGRGITIDVSNPSSGVTLFGPSGYQAFFPADGSGQFKDAPGLNATLHHFTDSSNNYWLTFHQTGLVWAFNGTYGNLYAIADQNGNTINFTYNGSGDLTSITDTQNRTVTLQHDSNAQIISFTDNANRSVVHTYVPNTVNGGFQLASITDVDGKTTSFTYDSYDRVQTITDPLLNQTSFSYANDGRVATITDAATGTIQFTYHASTDSACSGIVPNNGAPLPCTLVTDQNGHQTTYAYNPQLQVPYVKDALGHVTSQTFDATNYNVTQYGDALNDFSNFTFSQDGRNNLSTVADGTGASTSFGYPAAGASNQFYPLSQTDPQGNQTNYAYDSNGNLLSATDNSTGKALTNTYNSNGTVATQKDVNGNTTSYSYDSHGNLTTVTQPSPLGKTTLTVDALSRVSTLTDGNNHKTTYTYDNLGRILKLSYADGSTVSYSYDANGNVLTEQDHTGTTSFQYDGLNRIVKKTLPGGTVITTGYDKVGNLTSYNDGTGAVSYTYDKANRMITLTEPDGSQTTYNYDNANRKTSIIYPNSTGMLMTYDAAGHELTNVGGKITVSNGTPSVTTTYTNYSYSYTLGSSHTALLQHTTALDPISQTVTFGWGYTYDSQNRLTKYTKFNPDGSQASQQTYSYDANGNRLSDNYAGGSTNSDTYTYNAANELTQASSTGTFNGTQSTVTTTYSYDGIGNLTGVSNSLTAVYPQVDATQSHTYNALNQDVSGSSLGASNYANGYSGTNQNDRVSTTSTTQVYGGLGMTMSTSSAGTTEFVRCSCGLLNDERTPDGKRYYYLFDGLGSVVGMTDSTSSDVNRYTYDAYGGTTSQEQSGINNPWKYVSGYYDNGTGLYKFGIRYYDPKVGRWTQGTPVGGSLQETLKANAYVYAGDDPVNEVDPSGQFSVEGTLIPYPGVDVTFSARELAIYSKPWLFFIVTFLISVALNNIPFPIPDTLSSYISQELPGSILAAQDECGSQGLAATINFNIFDAIMGGTPSVACDV